jgi:erythronate-4-phosphate dehydrogenase
MKFVIDNKIPFIKNVLEPFGDVLYLPGSEISKKCVKDADALIVRTRTKCNAELLSGSNVKFIATATIGFDHIDTEFCKSRNIVWQNAPGCNSYSVQQYVASALLNIAESENFELKDRTIGIVGVGNVGTKIAKFAETLGMNILLNDPPRAENDLIPEHSTELTNKFVSINKIQKEADIITLHVPLNRYGRYPTHHLINQDFINMPVKSGRKIWIINSSRGGVVDSQALKEALKRKHIAGAVLDVWEKEPAIDKELLKLVKFATPHIAGYSADGKANGTSRSVQAVSCFFGLPLNGWTPENIPPPKTCEIRIDCKNKTLQNVIKEAFNLTYKIYGDDFRLRESPETFEKQRENYPVRREPPAFKLNLINDSANFAEKLKILRFV